MNFKILGVYSTSKKAKVGTGTTTHDSTPKTYWFVLQFSEDEYTLQALSTEHLPTFVRFNVPRERFLKEYEPEPERYTKFTLPALQTFFGEKFGDALYSQTDDTVAANRDVIKRIGFDQGDLETTQAFMRLLVQRMTDGEESVVREQRTEINKMGINLRKQADLDEALNYYEKVRKLNPDDDHLHFNMARVFYEKGNIAKTKECLDKALSINPSLAEAQEFLSFINEKELRQLF